MAILTNVQGPQVLSLEEWEDVEKALCEGKPLPVPAVYSSAVSMRLKAQVAHQRTMRELASAKQRPALSGQYAAQVGSHAAQPGGCLYVLTT